MATQTRRDAYEAGSHRLLPVSSSGLLPILMRKWYIGGLIQYKYLQINYMRIIMIQNDVHRRTILQSGKLHINDFPVSSPWHRLSLQQSKYQLSHKNRDLPQKLQCRDGWRTNDTFINGPDLHTSNSDKLPLSSDILWRPVCGPCAQYNRTV